MNVIGVPDVNGLLICIGATVRGLSTLVDEADTPFEYPGGRTPGLVGAVTRRTGYKDGVFWFLVNHAGAAVFYSQRELEVVAAPDHPYGLSGSYVASDKVVLSWAGPDDCTFRVERRTSKGKWKSLSVVRVKSYIDRDAVRDGVNMYRVRSVNKDGESEPSVAVSVTVSPLVAMTPSAISEGPVRIIRPRQRIVDVD